VRNRSAKRQHRRPEGRPYDRDTLKALKKQGMYRTPAALMNIT
jgi:hypothetical protein